MNPDILTRYADLNLPRYTSYPTAPNFNAEVDSKTYETWLKAVEPGTDLSLYLHFPFCRSMCWYCGCHTTVTARAEPLSAYLEALVGEIWKVGSLLPPGCRVRHVHFGGGTPTLIPARDFSQLMASLRAHFDIADDAQVAIEVDPRNLDDSLIETLGHEKVGRASIGVQTFDPDVQSAINRVQDFATVAFAVNRLRRAGIRQINFDLIYGLPLQSAASCLSTVEQALRLEPSRFSVFGYAHVPGFKKHQRKIDAQALPHSHERLAQASAIDRALVGAGYERIGLDHYARPDDPLAIALRTGRLHRNFQGYTTDDCPVLIGLGASAIGRLEQGFVQNVVGIGAYQQQVRQGRLAVARGYALTADDRLRGQLIERLMCDHQVDVGRICRDFGARPDALVEAARLKALEADGIIDRQGSEIRVRPEGRPLVRAVAAAFDAHLARSEGLHSRAV